MKIIIFNGFSYFYRASLSGSDDFVLFDSLDVNVAYSHVLCYIPILHTLNPQIWMETLLLCPLLNQSDFRTRLEFWLFLSGHVMNSYTG